MIYNAADFKGMHASVSEFVDELVKTMTETRTEYGEQEAVVGAVQFLTGTGRPALVAAALAVAALRLAEGEGS